MLNQLNEVSSLTVGLISLAVVVAIITVFVLIGVKKGVKSMLIYFAIFALSLTFACLLGKPMLSLFDKMFGFSMVFFNTYMLKFGQYQFFNTQVTTSNYVAVVNDFKNGDVGISATLKSFLEKVFDASGVKEGATTTLGAVASSTISYMISLFVVTVILFFVLYTLFTLLYKLILKRIKKEVKPTKKILGSVIGLLQGVFVNIIIIISISTLPILGISTDYLANGFESTKILNAPYQFVVSTEQSVYMSTFDFNKINSRASQTKESLIYGDYNNDAIEDATYQISVTLTPLQIVETFTKKDTLEVGSNTYNYILVDNSLYLYKDNLLKGYWQYKFDNNKIMYVANLDGNMVMYELG